MKRHKRAGKGRKSVKKCNRLKTEFTSTCAALCVHYLEQITGEEWKYKIIKPKRAGKGHK